MKKVFLLILVFTFSTSVFSFDKAAEQSIRECKSTSAALSLAAAMTTSESGEDAPALYQLANNTQSWSCGGVGLCCSFEGSKVCLADACCHSSSGSCCIR